MPYANREDQYAAQARHRQKNKENLKEYLNQHGCVDCGETDYRVLEFDHVRGIKLKDVGRMVTGSTYSWKKVLEEIAKCEVRCANCHRIKTYNQFGWN